LFYTSGLKLRQTKMTTQSGRLQDIKHTTAAKAMHELENCRRNSASDNPMSCAAAQRYG
jgi:hypothetical protein